MFKRKAISFYYLKEHYNMGPGLVYLQEPNKTKESKEFSTNEFSAVATGMQGWRINMEDAHLSVTNFGGDPTAALFGVFVGHGGTS